MVKTKAVLELGVLASGTGSNFVAIHEAIGRGELTAEIKVVICNHPDAAVLEQARKLGIKTECLSHRGYDSRQAFDAALASCLKKAGAQAVIMAGFDRLVGPELLSQFPDKVLNIHPAILPAFKGMDAQRQAVDYGVKVTGVTVHFVDEGVDHGPIIAQTAIDVDPFEGRDAVASRILEREHSLYPQAIQLLADGRLEIEGRRVKILPPK